LNQLLTYKQKYTSNPIISNFFPVSSSTSTITMLRQSTIDRDSPIRFHRNHQSSGFHRRGDNTASSSSSSSNELSKFHLSRSRQAAMVQIDRTNRTKIHGQGHRTPRRRRRSRQQKNSSSFPDLPRATYACRRPPRHPTQTAAPYRRRAQTRSNNRQGLQRKIRQ
jgi:hypothetical protein